ncbi:short-chain dehydrogenase-like protein [Xylariales sp. PMI_506]|nr:short-chain dehydrogenase-like protein [Xylariales sp. PMI_506]
MASYLITGTARGLGLGLVQQLAALPPDTVKLVFAATRSSKPSHELAETISYSNNRVKHVQLIVDDSDSIKVAAAQIAQSLDGNGLDYLFNNAAVREPVRTTYIEDMSFLREALDTNVTGTHEVISGFLPLLRQGADKKIVNFSSTLGAITTAQTDPSLYNVPYPAYKISKAGTHMLTALWSNRLKDEGFCVYMQSPGNLKTELAGGDKADLPVEVGAMEVLRIAHSAGPGDTGRHRNILVKGWENGGGVGGRYDGEDLPW